MKRETCNWIGAIIFVLLVLGIALSPRLANATGGGVITQSGPVATATSGPVTSAGGAGGSVEATIAGSGGANVTTKTFALGAPGYSGASQCPVGVIPVIGGTTGAEFCRALWTSMVTGDRGPVCKNAMYSYDMDEFCEDYWKKHGKP